MSLKQILKKIIKKIIYKEKADSETYVAYLRKRGARVGERTTFFAPRSTYIDTTKPYLISIGNDVQITYGVTILTHGYDWSVLKRVYGDVILVLPAMLTVFDKWICKTTWDMRKIDY